MTVKGLKRLLVLCVILLTAAVVGIGYLFWDYWNSNRFYDKLGKDYVSEIPSTETAEKGENRKEPETESETETESEGEIASLQVDFEGLQRMYPDIVAWIWQEGSLINYPVLYSGSNDTYLRRLPDGSRAVAGSLFLEEDNRADFSDSHSIIYGHNMKNGSMFGSLKKYRDQDYREKHRYFWLITPDSCAQYEVFAWEEVPGDSFVYTLFDEPGDAFGAFIEKLKKESEGDAGVTVADTDRILTLSTCTGKNGRFVVHAVKRKEL